MRKYLNYGSIILLMVVIVLSGCAVSRYPGDSRTDPGVPPTDPGTPPQVPISMTMLPVPGAASFPTGVNDSGVGSVANPYLMAETEVTYEQWYTIYTWAIGNGYTFANKGSEGSDGISGAAPTTSRLQPVVRISWRDAMLWCNALTEYYNALHQTSYDCVYYTDAVYAMPIKTSTNDTSVNSSSGSEDNPFVKPNATGFRLPTGVEWELAARYIDDTTYYPGNFVSGADAPYNVTATSDYDGNGFIFSTADVAIWSDPATSTVVVKSKSPNALGLYDMSGNVWEWCFDWKATNTTRVVTGGSYRSLDTMLRIGNSTGLSPWMFDNHHGFRPVRSE